MSSVWASVLTATVRLPPRTGLATAGAAVGCGAGAWVGLGAGGCVAAAGAAGAAAAGVGAAGGVGADAGGAGGAAGAHPAQSSAHRIRARRPNIGVPLDTIENMSMADRLST